MTLRWHHTEFGRITHDALYRIVRVGSSGWQLLDAAWDPLADPVPTIPEAQVIAEKLAARAKPSAARPERSTGHVSDTTSQTPVRSQTR